ncbi:MAG: aquaporin family protein [Cellulomonadaceae bacterium]|jgi:aquaporin Z|nr:aquaporin family protein [Cellulomonadaceae bacterium]
MSDLGVASIAVEDEQVPAFDSGVIVFDDAPSDAEPGIITRAAAEAFGTFVAMFGVIGVLTFNIVNQNSVVPVALSAGLMFAAAAAAVAHVSGGHFNPAVTLGFAIAGKTAWANVGPYILAQIVGAIAATFVAWAIVPTELATVLNYSGRGDVIAHAANGWGSGSPMSAISQGQVEFNMGQALLVTIIAAAVLVGVLLGASRNDSTKRAPYPPVVAGLTVAGIYLVTFPITNGGANPARALGAAVFAGSGTVWGHVWLFVAAPLVGAGLAALFFFAFAPPATVTELTDEELAAFGAAFGLDDEGDEAAVGEVADDAADAADVDVADADLAGGEVADADAVDVTNDVTEGVAEAADTADAAVEGAADAATDADTAVNEK